MKPKTKTKITHQKYFLVSELSGNDFENTINEKLTEGYVLVGNMVILRGEERNLYSQGMMHTYEETI